MLRSFIYYFILFLIVLLLVSCSHSKYTEATTYTFVFHQGDRVAATCSGNKEFTRRCKMLEGEVFAYYDDKTECYPQPQYLIRTNEQANEVYYKFCADELRLLEDESTDDTQKRKQ